MTGAAGRGARRSNGTSFASAGVCGGSVSRNGCFRSGCSPGGCAGGRGAEGAEETGAGGACEIARPGWAQAGQKAAAGGSSVPQ